MVHFESFKLSSMGNNQMLPFAEFFFGSKAWSTKIFQNLNEYLSEQYIDLFLNANILS